MVTNGPGSCHFLCPRHGSQMRFLGSTAFYKAFPCDGEVSVVCLLVGRCPPGPLQIQFVQPCEGRREALLPWHRGVGQETTVSSVPRGCISSDGHDSARTPEDSKRRCVPALSSAASPALMLSECQVEAGGQSAWPNRSASGNYLLTVPCVLDAVPEAGPGLPAHSVCFLASGPSQGGLTGHPLSW